jgi:predicted nucleic acid-binding protein
MDLIIGRLKTHVGGGLETVYFDTCVWCRPFDKLDHKSIIDEFKAVVRIIQKALEGRIEIVASDAVYVELSLTDSVKREKVETLIDTVATRGLKPGKITRELAERIAEDCGLDNMDAVHLALAGITIFLSTDRELYKDKKECIEEYGIVVKNPVEYEAGP